MLHLMGSQLNLLLMDAPLKKRSEQPAALTTQVDELDQAIDRYAEGAHAKNTKRAYRGDWERFEKWCARAGLTALPADARTLARYLAALAAQKRRPSTIRRARIAIASAHTWAGAPRPDHDDRVRLVERGIRRDVGVREEGAPAITVEQLKRMARAIGRGPRADRDRAMLLLGFAGAFRRGELVALRIEHLRFDEWGVTVFLPRSKEDPEGAGAHVRIGLGKDPALCPVLELQRWLLRRAVDEGPLFVRLLPGGEPSEHALCDDTVRKVVVRAAKAAGMGEGFSAHSLRAGFATAAHEAGHAEVDIRKHGRWQDRGSFERYLRGPANVTVL